MERCNRPAVGYTDNGFRACEDHMKRHDAEFTIDRSGQVGRCDEPIESREEFFRRRNNSLGRKLAREYYFELAVFCMDYHGGQWSRGYRILSRLNANLTDSTIAECRESEVYDWLRRNYAGKV